MSVTSASESSLPSTRAGGKLPRKDVLALWGGIIFSTLFTGLIWLVGGRLDAVQLLPDAGASWYLWKLPEPTFWSRATAWGFYLAHQLTLWGLIYYAQKNKTKYTTGLHRVNLWALAANASFITLRLVQTHVWYDGLAQDVSIWSSQVSVIILLVWVLVMENQRRGLFFGKPAPFSKEVVRFARTYHGYYFAWATIYTFWYHPTIATSGHLIGFFYMFLLMLQGSLFFTRIHTNRWWTLVQEFTVLIHGTLVAVMQGNGIWPMFAFGFAGLFIITQMHGIGLSLRSRIGLIGVFAASVIWVYSERGWAQINEIIRIPAIDYLAVFALAGIFWLGLAVARRLQPAPVSGSQ